ncbi:MAG: four helix bundle protein [Patescibacteria group bacterium]
MFSKLYDFYKNLSGEIEKFPKTKRYGLGAKLDQIALELIELIVRASYLQREQKLPVLEKSVISADILKILLRLAKDTKAIDNKKYLQLESNLQEIGRMIGGWKRSITK